MCNFNYSYATTSDCVCLPRAAVAKIPIQTSSFISCFITYILDFFRGIPRGRTRIFCADSGWKWRKPEGDFDPSCATILKDRERHRKNRSNYHCRNGTYLDMKCEQLNTERWKKQVSKKNKIKASTLAKQATRFHVPLHHWCSFLRSSLGPLHDDLLHGKFKTFDRLKRSKPAETTTEHQRFYVQIAFPRRARV